MFPFDEWKQILGGFDEKDPKPKEPDASDKDKPKPGWFG